MPESTGSSIKDGVPRHEDAIIGANFWMADERILDMGCDGADWLLAGCRRHDYHPIKRWSPRDSLYDIGRLMFDLAGAGRGQAVVLGGRKRQTPQGRCRRFGRHRPDGWVAAPTLALGLTAA